MAKSKETLAAEKALNDALRDYHNYKEHRPVPTWSFELNTGAEPTIDKLIKNAKPGSKERQKYIDEKAAYQKKLDYWTAKLETYGTAVETAQKVYISQNKLDPLLSKQQDVKDTGNTDAGLDAKIKEQQAELDKLKKASDKAAADAAAKAVQDAKDKKTADAAAAAAAKAAADAAAAKTKDTDGDGIPDVFDADPNVNYKTKTADDKAAAAKAAAEKAAADKAAADKAAAAQAAADAAAAKDLAAKTMYVDYLRATFAGLEDKTQKAQIDDLFTKAKTEGWSAEVFQSALEGTSWWQTTLPSLRSWYLDTHDPRSQSTTVEKIRNKVASVSNLLEKLGIGIQTIDPVTGKMFDKSGFVSGIAQEAVKNGWDDNQLSQYLAKQSPIIFSGGGEIGSTLNKIKQTAYQWGVSITPEYEKQINLSLLDAQDGRDGSYYITEMQRQAIDNPENKPFLAALNSGRSLYEVTRAYRGQMASLLEVDESNISWKDLMSKTTDSTTGNARTFADFTRQVKQDPLWQQTKNAKETYSNTALDLAKQFGFIG